MSTIRYFSGSREMRKRGPAAEQMMFEIRKKGKLPPGERYKRLLKSKLNENRQKLGLPEKEGFSFSKKIYNPKKLSARAEAALKEIAARKAAKLAKEERHMVIVTAKNYSNGSINKKGQIFDVAGNLVATVNVKNGKIATSIGMPLGKYKPKSYMTDLNIQNGINLYSPYFIQQRKLQQMQQQLLMQQAMESGGVYGPATPDVINLYGQSTAPQAASFDNSYGAAAGSPRQNIGMTAWGAMSDNAWGTFTDNVWGGSLDNVWGSNSTDVWGGIGVGSMWGAKGPKIWGTGSGRNYIKGITSFLAAFFGFKTKSGTQKLNAFRAAQRGSSGPKTRVRSSAARTSGGPARR